MNRLAYGALDRLLRDASRLSPSVEKERREDIASVRNELQVLLESAKEWQRRADAAGGEAERLRAEHEGARIVYEAQVQAQSKELRRLQDGLRQTDTMIEADWKKGDGNPAMVLNHAHDEVRALLADSGKGELDD